MQIEKSPATHMEQELNSSPVTKQSPPAQATGKSETLPGDGEVIQPASFRVATATKARRKIQLKPVVIGTSATLLVLLLVAVFLFIAKSVTIKTEPEFAEVEVGGGLLIPFGDGYLMLKGDYRLQARAEGYEDLNQILSVGSEQNQVVNLQLQKLPGYLTVQTEVSAVGEVWIDGETRGRLNEEIAAIAAGEHRIDVVTERYLPYATTIDITGLDQHQTMSVQLQPAWADVTFTSTPAGAQLYVDNELIAATPVTAQILQGEREVSIQLPGYKSWNDVLDVAAGEAIDISDVILQRADGLILVSSSPAQASVTVNNNYYGQTPVEVALAPGTTYNVTLFKDGYQPAQRRVNITSGERQSLNVKLNPQLGQIRIKSTPEDALLYVDGRLMGRADQVLSLPAVQTQISVKKEGFDDYSTTVLPRPNLEQLVAVKLKTLEEAKWEDIAEAITTQAGQELKLFKPNHTFTMGSSRREQGRRANEALHDVALTRPFYLATKEVTNRQFRQFINNHSSGNVKGNSLNGEDYPAVNVSWQQAALYCNWLSEQANLPPFYIVEDGKVISFNPQSIGYRMPTETEWAWAARLRLQGESGTMLKFAWGAQLQPAQLVTNIADRNAAPLVGYVLAGYDDGFAVSAPVGSFPANDKGLFDLDGNVSEWVNDFYDVASSLSNQVATDPIGPTEGEHHVIRGPSWAHGTVTELRLSFRDYGKDPRNSVGFRIARFVE